MVEKYISLWDIPSLVQCTAKCPLDFERHDRKEFLIFEWKRKEKLEEWKYGYQTDG